MSKLVVFNSISLDGVMQAPGRPDEDNRSGFGHGGWAPPYVDEVMGKVMAEAMAEGGPLLLGRRTYEDFHSYWPQQKDDPISGVLDNTQKYVASRTLTEPLPWQNSTLLTGDIVARVRQLREREEENITVLGSGELLRTLIPSSLIDAYVLLIHPLVLGTGRRLFPADGTLARLQLTSSVTTTKGVIIATYEPAEESR